MSAVRFTGDFGSGSLGARIAGLLERVRKVPRLIDVSIALTIAGLILLVGWLGIHAVNRLEELRQACTGDANLLEPMRAALKDRASIGEVCGVMREEFGEYHEA